jgi:hypothetical protein
MFKALALLTFGLSFCAANAQEVPPEQSIYTSGQMATRCLMGTNSKDAGLLLHIFGLGGPKTCVLSQPLEWGAKCSCTIQIRGSSAVLYMEGQATNYDLP